jgi:hypothetical protein
MLPNCLISVAISPTIGEEYLRSLLGQNRGVEPLFRCDGVQDLESVQVWTRTRAVYSRIGYQYADHFIEYECD